MSNSGSFNSGSFNSGQSVSLWMKTADLLPQEPLEEDLECDVCVVGAGMAGMSAAYMLASEGKSVVVLEADEVGSGQTSRTTAHLTYLLNHHYFELESLHGAKAAAQVMQSHLHAVDRIEEIISKESIFCDFARLDG